MAEYYLTEDAVDEIESDFIQDYNLDYWIIKIHSMKRILEDPDSFCDFLDVKFEDESERDETIEQLEMHATSEIVYTFYHSSEALFALMMASQSRVPWLVLREYQNYQIWNTLERILEYDDEEDQINAIGSKFYATLSPEEVINNSCLEIYEYINKMSCFYKDNEVYNSYKHGLRLMSDEEHITVLDGETDEVKDRLGGYAHIFLDDENIETESGNINQLVRVTRAMIQIYIGE